MKYKVVIIEDEIYAAQHVKATLEKLTSDMDVVAILENVEDSIKLLPALSPDLIIADIQLEDGVSFNIFNSLQWKGPVIFLTAYDSFAIKAFKVNGIDYLLKPVEEQDLLFALNKFRESGKQSNLANLLSSILPSDNANYKQRFAITIGNKLHSIHTDHISYIFYQNKASILVCHNGQKYPYSESLDQLESILEPGKFFRINRKYILSHSGIKSIDIQAGRNIILSLNPTSPEGFLQVSKDRISAFKSWLDQ